MSKKEFNQGAYIANWEKENYFRVLVRLPKNAEESIRKRAAEEGESLNGYIKNLITEDLKEHL